MACRLTRLSLAVENNLPLGVYYIGLISGTSMDAIDAALVDINEGKPQLLGFSETPYPNNIRKAVRFMAADSMLVDVAEMDIQLGGVFAEVALALIDEVGLKTADIEAIGSHGQTVLHLPEPPFPKTIQLGDPNTISYRSGIRVVADFRRMDLAAGGQGAPFAPAFHALQFRSKNLSRAVLNIGGIANLTLLPKDTNSPVLGFDVGPGNGLLDDWNQYHNHTAMDKDGAWAASGKPVSSVVAELLSCPYFHLPPPKSTGRDYFNLTWLQQQLIQIDSLNPEDVQASLLALTVESISKTIEQYAEDTKEIYVCGGGANNKIMMKMLAKTMPNRTLFSTKALNMPAEAVEAVMFAWLAYCRISGYPIDLTTITGAARPLLLGAIYKSL